MRYLNINMVEFIMENNLSNCYIQAIITPCNRELPEQLVGAKLSTNFKNLPVDITLTLLNQVY